MNRLRSALVLCNLAMFLVLLAGGTQDARAAEEDAWNCCQFDVEGNGHCCTDCSWLDCMFKSKCDRDSGWCPDKEEEAE